MAGPSATATGMYRNYKEAGLLQKSYQHKVFERVGWVVRSARYPPRGAIVFYPELTSEGHIGISAGDAS